MSTQLPFKRRQFLVDRDYQIQFVSRVFLTVMAIAVISALVSTSLLWMNMYRPELGSHPLLIGCLIAVAVTLLVELLLAIPVVFFLGVRQSHRIVGPMNRVRQTLEALGRGDFSQRIQVRHGDALEGMAQSINQMAESLERRFPTSP